MTEEPNSTSLDPRAVNWLTHAVAARLGERRRVLAFVGNDVLLVNTLRDQGHRVTTAAIDGVDRSIDSDSAEHISDAVNPFDAIVVADLDRTTDAPLLLHRCRELLGPNGILLLSIRDPKRLATRVAPNPRQSLDAGGDEDRLEALDQIERFLNYSGFVTSATARPPLDVAEHSRTLFVGHPVDPASVVGIGSAIRLLRDEVDALRANMSAQELLNSRLERYQKGVSLLRGVMALELQRSEGAIADRDRVILRQQAELFEKVGERDRMIRELQAELHEKVGQRDEMIRDLQSQLLQVAGERNLFEATLNASQPPPGSASELARGTPERGSHQRALNIARRLLNRLRHRRTTPNG